MVSDFYIILKKSFPTLRLIKKNLFSSTILIFVPIYIFNPSRIYFDLRNEVGIFCNDKDQFSQHRLLNNASFPHGFKMPSLAKLINYVSFDF